MRITLLRHGKPDIAAWPRIKAHEMSQWIAAYNQAGINSARNPPQASIDAAMECNFIVASDLRRSIESAQRLAGKKQIVSDAIFREADLPYEPHRLPKLPPAVWAAYFRLLWFSGKSCNAESTRLFRKRANNAAHHLAALAREHGSVLFVGHGIINRFIAKELKHSGWEGPKHAGKHYWSFSTYIHAS